MGETSAKGKVNTLEPGPFADGSIPAWGKERNFTKSERDQVNEIGEKSSCHTCGAASPGTKSGNWVLDHQPVSALIPDGIEQTRSDLTAEDTATEKRRWKLLRNLLS